MRSRVSADTLRKELVKLGFSRQRRRPMNHAVYVEVGFR
jgi:hypothetical protein